MPTLVPNLVSSFEAPTTANLGDERKAFFCSAVPGMVTTVYKILEITEEEGRIRVL